MNPSNDVSQKYRINKFTGNPTDIELGTIDEKESENVTDILQSSLKGYEKSDQSP